MVRKVVISPEYMGVKIAEPIYSDKGIKVISEGVVLTERIAEILRNMNINVISINSDKIDAESELLENKVSIYKELDRVYNSLRAKKYIDIYKLKDIVEETINKAKTENYKINNVRIMDTLGEDYSDEMIIHSINVGLMAMLTGIYLKYSKEHLINLTMAGLLHDTGLIVGDKEELSDGINILRNLTNAPTTVYAISYQCRLNQISNDKNIKCHDYSKIVGISCDLDHCLNETRSIVKSSNMIIDKMGVVFEENAVKSVLYANMSA